ncbi:MAG: lipopolysaccharide biosynthesis protein [Oligoflexia bacterium]|nr:lipopolysaccharide biosynthesis protein [Oligoflexia bacterium]
MLKSILTLFSANILSQIIRFLTLIVLARKLDADHFGYFNYVMVLLTQGMPFVELGLKNYGIREYASGKNPTGLINQIAMTRLLAFGPAALWIFIISAEAFGPDQDWIFLSTMIAALLFQNVLNPDYWLIAKGKIAITAHAQLLQALVFGAGVAVLSYGLLPLKTIGVLYLMSFILSWLWLRTSVDESEKKPKRPKFTELWLVVKNGFPFLLVMVIGTYQLTIDFFILGQTELKDDLGAYAAGVKCVGIALSLINAIFAVFQPKFAQHAENFKSMELQRLLHASTRPVWIIMSGLVLVCLRFPNEILTMTFGEKYLGASFVLLPLSLGLGFFALALGPTHTLYISNRAKQMVGFSLSHLLLTALCVWAGLVFYETIGVAWGMALGQLFFMISAWRFFGFKVLLSIDELGQVLLPAVFFLLPSVWLKGFWGLAASCFCFLIVLMGTKFWKRAWFKAFVSLT